MWTHVEVFQRFLRSLKKKSAWLLEAEQLVLELMPVQSGQNRLALSKIPARKQSLASFLPTQNDVLDTSF